MSSSGSLAQDYTEFVNWACAPFYALTGANDRGINAKRRVLPKVIRAIGLGWVAVMKPAYTHSIYRNVLIFSDWGTTENYYQKICEYLGATQVPRKTDKQAFSIVVNLLTSLPAITRHILGTARPTWLSKDIQAVTWSFIRAHLVLSARPDAIVVLSQHSVTSRALIWVARKKHIRVVYLPHAPTATNIAYRDMPVHVAGLWSYRDRDIYRELATSSSAGLLVVGNPTVQTYQLPATLINGASIRAVHLCPLSPRYHRACSAGKPHQ